MCVSIHSRANNLTASAQLYSHLKATGRKGFAGAAELEWVLCSLTPHFECVVKANK